MWQSIPMRCVGGNFAVHPHTNEKTQKLWKLIEFRTNYTHYRLMKEIENVVFFQLAGAKDVLRDSVCTR